VTDKNRNLLFRLASAAVLLPLVVYLLYRGGYLFAALLGFASAAVAYEYMQITLKAASPVAWVGVALAAVLPVFPVWRPVETTAWYLSLAGGYFYLVWGWHLLKGPLAEAPLRSAHLLTAVTYGSLGMTTLSALRELPEGMWWVVCALVITWGNDTSAYFAGRFLGKHKLYPEVSPNKTWEGFAGGLLGSIGGLFIVKLGFFPQMSAVDCVVLGGLGGVLGPMGDLCESMLKRAYGVKDSGNIIPGHGGMLDRIDALLFNAPAALLYVQFLRPTLGL
jgi:phosphatidate cytidylyltransferase